MRPTRFAAPAVSTGACVLHAEPPPPVSLVPKRRRKPPHEPPAPETERCCKKCHETKRLEQFARSRQSRDGRTSMCKSCDAQRARERYRANIEQ